MRQVCDEHNDKSSDDFPWLQAWNGKTKEDVVMGIYLGQLPPAEFARLKAELAETLVANFCYPRFFDWRTNSLRTRPVDRAKRQEVWLYLSSFDFAAWSRLDVTTPDFQNQVERLFIQFVQHNRSFFGNQGRKRMPDVRMLIGTASASVVQGLRKHITRQKQEKSTFGSPRPVVSWLSQNADGSSEPGWEEISAATLLLQQQLQELRGEAKSTASANGKASSNGNTPTPTRHSTRSQPLGNVNGELSYDEIHKTPTIATPSAPLHNRPVTSAPYERGNGVAQKPAATVENPASVRQSGPLSPAAEDANQGRLKGSVAASADALVTPRKSEPLQHAPVDPSEMATTPVAKPKPVAPASAVTAPPSVATKPKPTPSRQVTQATAAATDVASGQRGIMTIGDDDMAIFEQLRLQLLLWLRVEAIRAGLEISGQSPLQLLDSLRQQGRVDETRLQVVSTLLNLSNQVIKTGQVSILDYKQALMFHLMHTRNL
jgi:hypothetical protein